MSSTLSLCVMVKADYISGESGHDFAILSPLVDNVAGELSGLRGYPNAGVDYESRALGFS